MIAFAAQSFLYEIAYDAKSHSDAQGSSRVNMPRECNVAPCSREILRGFQSNTLTMEALSRGLEEHGIRVVKTPYYADPKSS